jgi:hypothetical protein
METKTKTKKHGVIVTVGGKHNTKTVWNRGYRMITYRRQPKRIRFKSKMVNDKNQHLCGGWGFAGLEDNNLWIERQLIAGRKPFGVMFFWGDGLEDGEDIACAERLRAAGLIVREGPGFVKGTRIVEACQDIHVGEIGDMSDLVGDYIESGAFADDEIDDLCREFNVYSRRKLKSFLGKKWDTEHNPLWVTGLILGYPVENTISCYHDAVS